MPNSKSLLTVALLFAGLRANAQGIAPADTAAVTAAERAAVVSNAAKLLESLYVKPAVGAQMRRSLETANRAGAYERLTRPEALADSLTRQLRRISHDEHVHVFFSPNDPRLRPEAPDTLDRRERRRRTIEEITDINFGIPAVEVLPGGIGYIDMVNFIQPSFGAGALEAAMGLVADTRALIVDLRGNGGGHPDQLMLFLSYFFKEPVMTGETYSREDNKVTQSWTYARVPGRHYGQDRPLFVLTGDSTFSAAEGFAAIIKSFHRGIVIGSQTAGGGHQGDYYPIADRFLIFVPWGESRKVRPEDEVEGKGVTPDIRVAQGAALDRAYLEALLAVRQKLTSPFDISLFDPLIAEARRTGTPRVRRD